ncbi:MAG: flagellar hook-associated protein FlgL [Deltaproteobacteria bacterium]
MRVSTRLLSQGLQGRLQKLSEDLKNINEKIASGKRINRPSDDPIAVVNSMTLKTSLSQIEQYQRNIQNGMSWLNLRESALTGMNDLVTRAKEISVQMANDTQSADTRASAAIEIGELLDQAIALGNTELGGNYIFAGYRTKTTPFSKTVVGGIETAQYNGDTNDFQLQIGKGETVVVGRNGQNALMDSNLFTTLGTLKKALEDNDVTTVRQQLDQLEGVSDTLDSEVADTGAKANRLDMKASVFGQLALTLKEQLSNVEDADLAEMITLLNQKELAYQAAMMTSVRISELSILNYL